MSVVFVKAWLIASAAQDRLRREEGQTLVEYTLILAVVAGIALGAFTLLGGRVTTRLNAILP